MSKNYSYTYLLPLLGDQVYFDKDILKHVKNTYLFSNKHIDKAYFFITCSFNYSDPKFSEMESRLMSNDLVIESHDIGEDVLYVFKFPEEYEEEYYNFIKGKYSKFKKDAKIKILSFWTELYGDIPSFVTGSLLKIKQILFKDKKLKERMEINFSSKKHPVTIDDKAELGHHIDVEKEQFIFPEKSLINLDTIKDIFK